MALAKLITKSNRKSLEILYYGKRWMLGSLIQLATQGIETQLHINPPIVSYGSGCLMTLSCQSPIEFFGRHIIQSTDASIQNPVIEVCGLGANLRSVMRTQALKALGSGCPCSPGNRVVTVTNPGFACL